MATLGLLATAVSSILLWSQGSQADGLADIDHVVLFMQGMLYYNQTMYSSLT
jgi:hypothetical protein